MFAKYVNVSIPVRFGYSAKSPGMYPMCLRIPTASACVSRPRMVALPEVGLISSSNVLIVVDFPAPFGPRKPNTSPSRTSKFTSSIPICFP